VRNGRVEAVVTLGTRNGADPVTAETVVRIASVSKVFTAAAAARLVADGALSLDADLRGDRPWLAAVAPGPEPVTLRGLLSHTAGFDDRAVGMFAREADDVIPLGDYLRAHMPHRTSVPGRWARYSNQGAALAGLVVEETTGQPFDAAVAGLILEPLDMGSSSFAQPLPPELTDRLARAYRCSDEGCEFWTKDMRRWARRRCACSRVARGALSGRCRAWLWRCRSSPSRDTEGWCMPAPARDT
jgi:CubicO group peptidase (beta-lactamase class C family)